MKNVPKIDLGLTGYDELFMNDTERMETKLPHIYDIPLELIDDFPDHPFKVRDDEDMMQLVESTQLSRYRLPTAMSSTKRPCTSMSRRIIPQKKAGLR